ncbi:unnamed protein product [Amoebophrya sp. A25]|nr:unnamed protein product [Amoebophrya sp. A25]|eukprot:GSA25T00013372001.1
MPPKEAKVHPAAVPPLVVFVINAKTGATVWAEISTKVLVARLKRVVELQTGIPPKDMMLVNKGEALIDDKLIGDSRIDPFSTIMMLDGRDIPENPGGDEEAAAEEKK